MGIKWGLLDKDECVMPPLRYTSGKTQADVVNEVLDKLDDHDIAFLLGGVGTGKSAIALHIIASYGKGIISTPTKLLERQYKRDYCGRGSMRILEPDGDYLDIQYLMGRTNFNCLYPPEKREKKPVHCGHHTNVCTKHIPEGASRCSVAMECPYWSPVYAPGLCKVLLKRGRTPIEYESITGKKVYYRAEEPCPYYDQFIHFTKPGAIIMNSAKWEAETWIGRKPRVPVEIIDEGDEFLDTLTYRMSITRRIFERISREKLVEQDLLGSMLKWFEDLLDKYGVDGYDGFLGEEEYIVNFLEDFIEMISRAEPSDFIFSIVQKVELMLDKQQISWARTFRAGSNEGVTVFIPSPYITLNELAKRSGKLLFMSATVHAARSFREIFKIRDPVIIKAEERFPGMLYIMDPETGGKRLPTINFRVWGEREFRMSYWRFLDELIEVATRPCLVQIHAFKYLPPKYKASEEQRREDLWHFGHEGVRFSTKTDRGIDLRDDLCRSIIVLKYPMPNTEDIVFKTMRRLLGEEAFWDYLRDIADRNLVQQCGRAVRNKDDWCEVYTLDGKVLRELPRLWRGKCIIKKFLI